MILLSNKTRVIGVDITLARTTCAVVDIRGEVIATRQFSTDKYPNISEYVSALTAEILALVEANGGYEMIRSVGISSPSGHFRTGCIENAPNMPWKGIVPLAAMLRDRLGLAVALANNAHVTALGEQAFGAAHGMRNFVVISIGHGLGSCIFSNGVAHLGADGFAGEVGHTCAIPNGRECGCGKRGCLETYVAANGVVRTACEVLEEHPDEPSRMREAENLTPLDIFNFCEEGDELAIETFRRAGHSLGVGLANYASVLNPEAFIFTGGVSHAGKWLLEPAYEAFNAHVFHNIEGKVNFILSSLDDHIRNVLGASALAWTVQEYSLFK